MAILPDNTHTTEHHIESRMFGGETPRGYLGMSGIGNLCLRAQWYGWRFAVKKKIAARVQRIFNRGHSEEESVIKDLTSIGIEVFRRRNKKKIILTGVIGEKQETIVGFHKHSMGHPDGRLLGVIEAPKTEHLLETKSMNDKYFSQLIKEGLQKAFAGYYSQVTMYMGKMKLKRALFIATNKNNQSRFYKRIKFDEESFKILEEREENIILSENPPTRKYDPSHYKCNWCNFNNICHYGSTPEANCRTCKHVDLLPKGKWFCGLKKNELDIESQVKGCGQHVRLF